MVKSGASRRAGVGGWDARLAAASSELWRIHDSRNLRNLGRRSAAGELFPVLRRAARGADVEIILG